MDAGISQCMLVRYFQVAGLSLTPPQKKRCFKFCFEASLGKRRVFHFESILEKVNHRRFNSSVFVKRALGAKMFVQVKRTAHVMIAFILSGKFL